jgi:hypothetical protein
LAKQQKALHSAAQVAVAVARVTFLISLESGTQ